eukprot:GCRY01000052.1.p2 GENE.GCRY01000052.1~~GCRY01000052.1.p2  ORF type:complete len:106 (-),score=19.67 GCRY01000052.1:66-383(-)
MAPQVKSKDAKAKAASAGGKKKKWSKGKVREKANNQVIFTEETYNKMLQEVPKFKLITPAIVSERLRINISLARRCIAELVTKGQLRQITHHNMQQIFTRATAEE